MSAIRKLCAAALGAAIAVAGTAVAGTTTAYAAEFEFELHHFLGPKAPAHRLMLEPWAQPIMDASGGRIAIEISRQCRWVAARRSFRARCATAWWTWPGS